MSGGRAKRRKKQAWRMRYAQQQRSRVLGFPCPHCGSGTPHFIPPSFGDPGFYACSMVASLDAEHKTGDTP